MTRAQAVGAEVVVTRATELTAVLGERLGAASARGVGIGQDVLQRAPVLRDLAHAGDDWPPIAITQGAFGIAATGSVVLAERHHADRELSLLCRRHIVLLPPSIVPALRDTAPYLQTWAASRVRPYVSFVTGPSRTSDIERVLTIGVHGPAELVIVVVEDWEPDDA